MSENVFDILQERGFLDQATHPEELRETLEKEKITFYTGFDCTADSLTVGHYSTIMAMRHLQRAGHKPIGLIGGGTTMIGDPSGRNDMRQLMTEDFIDKNAEIFKKQLSSLLDFSSDEVGIFDNNKNWLLNLNFLDFVRDIGVHFSVNRMLNFDCYKNRMEQGLTFFEFSYMLMQSYDFLHLYRKYNCKLQLGGSDQWSNMLGGYELVRKIEKDKVYSLTLKLLTTADGIKMGKTMAGAIWLDPNKTSSYELFQYFRNTDDRDVEKFLGLLTFLPMEEVRELGSLEGSDINKAKEILAYEITKDIHGIEAAEKALETSRSLFSSEKDITNAPNTDLESLIFEEGIGILDLLKKIDLVKSSSDARRLIEQGGISINGIKIVDPKLVITKQLFENNSILIKKGKKIYHKITMV